MKSYARCVTTSGTIRTHSFPGAGIILQRNALETLEMILPSLAVSLDEAGAVFSDKDPSIFIGCGPFAGQQVDFGLHGKSSTKTVGRHAFLNKLLSPVPSHFLHANKQLVRIVCNEPDGEVQLLFSDGSTAECDVLIGADGIHSHAREFVLDGDPATSPVYAGWWHMALIIPLDDVWKVLGSEIINVDEPVQCVYVGEKGQFILHDLVHGENFVESSYL